MPSLAEKDERFFKMKLINALIVLNTLHLLFVSYDIQEALKQLISSLSAMFRTVELTVTTNLDKTFTSTF